MTKFEKIKNAISMVNARWSNAPKKMTKLGKCLYLVKAVKVFKNGDNYELLFNRWNPITWLMTLYVIPSCLKYGDRVRDQIPLSLPEYWEERKEEIEWL